MIIGVLNGAFLMLALILGLTLKSAKRAFGETGNNTTHEPDLTPKQEVLWLFQKIAEGDFNMNDTDDNNYRTITVEGLEDVSLIWMEGYGEEELFLVEKGYKKYLYFDYDAKTNQIRDINERDSLFYYDLMDDEDLFEEEWTEDEIKWMKQAVRTVSLICNDETFDCTIKTTEENKQNVLNQFNQVVQTSSLNQVPEEIANAWRTCIELRAKIDAYPLDIEEKHAADALIENGKKLLMQYQKMNASLQAQAHTDLLDSLYAILHKLHSTEEKIMQTYLYEFKKTTRVVKNYETM